jgi:OsmC-like protein
MVPDAYTWTVRAHAHNGKAIRVHAGRHASADGEPGSAGRDSPLLSALDCLLGALAADLVGTLADCARRDHLELNDLECRLSGQLDDGPVSGGVGVHVTPALSRVRGTLYVSAGADEQAVRRAWEQALRRSSLFTALKRRAAVSLELHFGT